MPTLEVGYLDQHGFVRHRPDTDDHAASLNLSFSFWSEVLGELRSSRA